MNEPSFYAVIPANVRYSGDVCANAKLLYGEITALCNQRGFCWAKNAYFAGLYKVSPPTISEWVAQLKRAGFIRFEVDPSKGNERKIWLVEPIQEKAGRYSEKAEEGSSEKTVPLIDNTTKKNRGGGMAKIALPQPLADQPGFVEEFQHFITERQKVHKKPLSERGAALILATLAERPGDAVAALQMSIKRTWRGFEWSWFDRERAENPVAAKKPVTATKDQFERFRAWAAIHYPAAKFTTWDSIPANIRKEFLKGEES